MTRAWENLSGGFKNKMLKLIRKDPHYDVVKVKTNHSWASKQFWIALGKWDKSDGIYLECYETSEPPMKYDKDYTPQPKNTRRYWIEPVEQWMADGNKHISGYIALRAWNADDPTLFGND